MERILIVDDDANSLEMLDQELQEAGFETRLCVSGEAALDAIRGGGIDLMLLDIMMPDVSGLDVLRRLREQCTMSDLPVIVVTAKDHSRDVVESLTLGANDYLIKPIDISVLLARVRTQLSLRRLIRMKDELVQIASHDLKGPLMIIMSYAALMEERIPGGAPAIEEVRRFARRIRAQARDMGRLIEDLLDFQVIDDGTLNLFPKPFDLNRLAERVVDDYILPAAEKGIGISFKRGADLPPIEADETRIQQVLENLVGNAIKFSPEQSRTTVSTFALDGSVGVEVADTGPGLRESDLEKVFVKFAQLSNRPTRGEKSHGIGLAICKRLIEMHNGEIGVRNNPERGATFWFRLPIDPGNQAH
ncbi:MAG: response regulator [Candidatus Sumerlaeota bacterium]|nr:response regulator [Candidatus Sumerlaeota bacterium]